MKNLTTGHYFIDSLVIAFVLTGISYLVGMNQGWITSLDWLEIFAVFTSYSCTYLCVMQKRFNYIIGMVSTAALCALFYRQGLLASATQNAILCPWLIYGWFRWRSDDNTRPVTSLWRDSTTWLVAYAAFTVLTYIAVVKSVELLGGNLPYIDTGILIGSILAQILLDQKKLESWYVWAVVDIAAIGLYFEQGLYLVAFQFVFFLANTIWGWYEWKKTQNEELQYA